MIKFTMTLNRPQTLDKQELEVYATTEINPDIFWAQSREDFLKILEPTVVQLFREFKHRE